MEIYNHEYFEKHHKMDETPTGEQLSGWRANLVLKYFNGSVIDWGCGGAGFLSSFYQRRGMYCRTIVGVDVNPYCVGYAVSKGLKAFSPEMYEAFVHPDVSKDPFAMTFWDVFEHIQDPRAFLRHYQPNWIFLSLPCLDGFYEAYSYKEDIQLWKHYRPQEHLWNFTEDSLRKYLVNCGYETLEVTFDESDYRVDSKLGKKNIMTFVAKRT